MFSPRLRHTDQWRFGVFWNGAGDGTSDGGGGQGGGAGTGAATAGGGAGGGIGGDTAAAAQGPPGSGLGGLSAVGPTSFGQDGGGPAATSTTTGGAAPGGGPGAGISGGGGGGGAGAAPAGAPTGGSAGGVAGGGFGAGKSTLRAGPQAVGDPSLAATVARPGGIGTNPSDTALLAKAGQIGTPGLGRPGLSEDVVRALNISLGNLTRGGGGGFGFGDQSQASPLGSPGTTLGQLALAQQRKGMNMGFPAIEGVSPGLTAAPAGPSPSPGQNVNAFAQPGVTAVPGQTNVDFGPPGLTSSDVTGFLGQTAPAAPGSSEAAPTGNPFGPAEVALAQDLAGTNATANATAPAPVSPAETATAQNTANLAAQVANQPAVTQMNAAADNTAPAAPGATPAAGGRDIFSQLFQDIFGGGVSNPTTLPQLAAMLGIGGQLG